MKYRVCLLCPMLVASVVVSQKPAKEQAAAPPASQPRTESHLLQFERIVMMNAPEGMRPMDFEIGKEEHKKTRNRHVDIHVALRFIRGGKPLPVTRQFIESMIQSAETTGDSPWRLLKLRIKPVADKAAELWTVDQIIFSRREDAAGRAVPLARPFGHKVLAALAETLEDAKKKGVRYKLTQISIEPGRRDAESKLNLEFVVMGLRFRSGFVRFRELFAKACNDPDGAFTGFADTRGEKLLADPKAEGASYQLCLTLREAETGAAVR